MRLVLVKDFRILPADLSCRKPLFMGTPEDEISRPLRRYCVKVVCHDSEMSVKV